MHTIKQFTRYLFPFLPLLALAWLVACAAPGGQNKPITPPTRAAAIATPTLAPTTAPATATATVATAATSRPTLPPPTAVPAADTADLLAAVQAGLPADAFDDLAVLPLHTLGSERPLWAVHSVGFRNYDLEPPPHHFLAIYTYQNGRWLELARQDLNPITGDTYVSPDIISEQGVNQVDIDPAHVWLAVDGIVGAHGGTFQLLRFDGSALTIDLAASNASPGLSYLEDLNDDGQRELILRLHEHYIFCYACGVRFLYFQVHTWDPVGQQLQEVDLQPLPADQPAAPAANRAVELAQAGLWPDARTEIEAAQQIGGNSPSAAKTLTWNAALIRHYYDAWVAELSRTPYPLLTRIFFGDYAAALATMRPYTHEQIFRADTPLIQGTIAEGYEQWMAGYILDETNAALTVRPDLAAAYYLRAWAAFLVNPADPAIAADLVQAATLDPDEPLFAQADSPPFNRIQFAAGATSAAVEGQIGPQEIETYVLQAQAGQRMTVDLLADSEEVRVEVRDSAGDYLGGTITPTLWQADLPATADYVIRVFGGETAVPYTLRVFIPQRIQFAPGATEATIQGEVAAYETDEYILSARENQTMNATIDAATGAVLLTIVGADGIPLTNGLMSGASAWRGPLPATQDYLIRAIGTEQGTSYTLTITIE